MYLGYDHITISNSVLTVTSFTVPAKAQFVELQATENNINYTMDNSSTPTAGTTGEGMRLVVGNAPKLFTIDDFNRIKLIRAAAADGKLNVHYGGGRDV